MKINKRYILLLSVMLVFIAFFYGYYITMKNINKLPQGDNPNKKPNTTINNNSPTPGLDDTGEVAKFPEEEKITPNTVLVKQVVSINTGNFKSEYEGKVPDEIVDYNKEQAEEYFKSYGTVTDFSKYRIIVERELPYFPDSYVVKLDGDYINVYKTDSSGNAIKYEDFEPIPCKNRDSQLEKGIEVNSIEEIDSIIQDYE